MAWSKLTNPKPNSTGPLPMAVRVKARELKRRNGGPPTRYIAIQLGSKLCDQAKFVNNQHGVHILVGSGADAGKIAIVLDDQGGKFVAKRRKGATYYDVYIREGAAAGNFSTTFPPFDRSASTQRFDPAQPPAITFEATADFLDY